MASDDIINWNNIIQKLAPQVSDQSLKGTDEPKIGSIITFHNNLPSLAQTQSPETKEMINEMNKSESISQHSSSKNDPAIYGPLRNIDESLDVNLDGVKSVKDEEKSGRTIAVNSQFICYIQENDSIFIQNLKNLSITSLIPDINSRVLDIALLDDQTINFLAFVCQDGTVGAYAFEIDSLKESILLKPILKHNLSTTLDSAQIVWKDMKKIGIAKKSELVIIEIALERNPDESHENLLEPLAVNIKNFERIIRDFAFSPKYSLVFLLMDDNTVVVSNLDGFKLRVFTPHADATTIKILSYRNLSRHEQMTPNTPALAKSYDYALKDVFITISEDFEIKVWDLSEWIAQTNAYNCIETFQISQPNDKLNPLKLVKRFAFFDPSLNFLFVSYLQSNEEELWVHALHIDPIYYGYSEDYKIITKTRKFFNNHQCFAMKQNDFTDIGLLNLNDEELDLYFKKDQYIPMADLEPMSNKTQEGSIAFDTKTNLIFFVHFNDTLAVKKVQSEKVYPLYLIDDIEKLARKEKLDQLDTQSISSKGDQTGSFPPELPGVFKEILKDQRKQASEEEKLNRGIQSESDSLILKKNDSFKSAPPEIREIEQNESVTKPEKTESADKPAAKRKNKLQDKNKEVQEEPKDKNFQPKIVQRNEPKPKVEAKSVAHLEKEFEELKNVNSSVATKNFEQTMEKMFNNMMNNSTQLLEKKFSRIEEVIEAKINERVTKLQLDSVTNAVSREIDGKIQREFTSAFEKTVTPCFERYLGKLFEQVCNVFEKGQKFYIDKLNIEQAKSAQVKETMSEVIKSFVQISTALTESIMSNQNHYNKMDSNFQDKQTQISRLIDQMNEILIKQQDIHKKLESTEKNINEMIEHHHNDLSTFQNVTEKYMEKFNEMGPEMPSPRSKTPQTDAKPEDTKKEGSTTTTSQPHGYQPNMMFNQNLSTSNYNTSRKNASLAEQLPYLQNLASLGNYQSKMPGLMSPGSSQILSGGYGGFDPYNPYQKGRTSGMMFNPNYGYNQHYNPERGMMPNYPLDYHLLQQQLELLKRGKEEGTTGTFPSGSNNAENLAFFQNQDPKRFFEMQQQLQSLSNQQQNQSGQQQTNMQNSSNQSNAGQNQNQNASSQNSLPNLTSQPSFGPQNNQTTQGNAGSGFTNPYFTPQNLMNTPMNKSGSRNPVDQFYQIPLVSSMVKESSKESQSSQPSTQSNQNNQSPQSNQSNQTTPPSNNVTTTNS